MDRSQEKSSLLSTKVHSLDAKTANPRQQFAHEAVTTNPIFRPLKAFPSQATLENGLNPAGFSSSEVAIGRNSEQFISPLQAQYYQQTVPSAALGMSLPYGMIAGQGMDPRALNAGNLLYTYGNPVMSFPNFSAGYGQGQRVKNSEETAPSEKTSRPTDPPGRSSKEPMRTESVIKTVTDKQEAAKKPSDIDKRNPADSQVSNIPLRYPDRGKGSEFGNSDDGKNKGLPLRDVSLRDTQSNEDKSRRDKQSIADYDRTRDKLQKAKVYDHLAVDSGGNKRPSNGLTSRVVENGGVTFSSHDKSYTTSESRSSPYPANEPPTLVPYHNVLPSRTTSSTTNSNVPSTMPKLTPIAPRMSNGSPLTVPYSSEGSSPYAAWRQSYPYPMNPASSAPSVTSHSGVVPWTTNYPSKPPQGEKVDENMWRTKQAPREERDLNRTSGYEHVQKPVARNFYPLPSNERPTYYGALPPQLRAPGTEKSFGGKDVDDDSRDVSRDPSREAMTSSEQSKLSKGAFKFGVGQASLRKEPDIPSSKLTITGGHEDYQRSQPFVNRNEKSVVGEYVKDYNNKSDDGKGSLAGNVIVHSKESGSYRLSVEKRDGKYKYPEMAKSSRVEENRPTSGSYDSREQSEANFMGVPRAEPRSSAREDKDKESADRARPVERMRASDQSSYKEHVGRKPDSRDIPTVSDGKKSNDRNNNSTAYGAFPFFKYGAGGFPSVANGEQMRYVERSGAVNDDKVFVPPNATIEMYERREQEMEKNGLRKTDFTAYARNMESNRMSNSADDGTKRNDDRRVALTRDEPKPKLPTGRFENEKRSEREEISSDENDDATRHVSREALSPDKRAQLRPPQPSDRTVPSPAAGAVRQRRLSSPLSDQRSTSAPNPYGASLAPGFHSRRAPSDGSESHSRDSAAESGLSGLGNPGGAQYLRMDGAAFGNPYFAPFLAAPQGMSEAPFMLVDPSSIYGAMYRPPMIEAAPPGMFPPGALAADPMTGQIMMIPPEAYIPMVTADNAAFMNPMMDPRYAGMWGVPGGIDEAQWQQLYQQMMQPYQQQHKQQQAQSQQQQQLHERNKQFLLGKQGTPFPFPGNPFYYGEKHFDKQQEGESKDGKPADQQQKAREETQEHAESQAKEPAPRPKPETATPQEHVQRVPASRDTASRNSEFVQQQETSNQREEKPAIDSRWLKEAHQKLTEKHSAVQAQLDAQGQFAKQLKDYLSRDPFSQFPFPAPQAQAPFPRDVPKVNLTIPTTTTSARPPEVDRNSASPKTVSAAVTLSAMEKARGEDSKWTTRLPPSSKNDTHVVNSQNSVVDRVRSPRLWTGAESMITKEIVETPRKLEAQPNLVGERVVSRESRQVPGGQMPLQFPHKLMALGNIASKRPVQEKPERESERERLESYYRAYDRGLPVSYNEVSRNASDKTIAPDLENHLPIREQPQRIDSYGEIISSFVKSGIERTERGLQPANVRLRENLDSLEENRGNFQAVVSHEKPLAEGFDSDSEFEDDFNTRCELRRIASSFVPLKTDLENKENSTIFSLRPFRSEAERKQIRENIDRLRSMAKRRSSKDRFMVFSRRKDLRSPTTILNSVTSAISDVAGVESVEKEMRMKLADLQKKYREKVRELARLQPRYGADDGTGKSTPIKRGPGRPRKRKYFGAGTKGEKSSPVLASDFNKEGEESLPVSGTQSPELNAAASESESLVSKDSEPPKKKKKRAKQKSPVEREERASAPPSRGLSPVESTEFSVPVQKKKKSRKPTPVEDEAVVQPSKDKPTSGKKKGPGTGKRRKGSPTEDSPNQQTVPQPPTALSEISTNELDNNAEFAEPKNAPKTTKVKKQKPKKRARPKLTIETPEGYDDEKPHDEVTPDSADRTCETPRAPTPTKGKKAKAGKKKRKSTSTTPPKEKFEFPDVTSQDDSLSENSSSVSPKDIGKEVAMAARKEMEAQRNMREASSDVDDDVFTPGHDGRDGLSLLAQASFASIDKPSKRKRSEAVSPTDDKKKGRPKKPSESPPYEPDAPVVTKKKKKKKITEEDSVKEPKKKKKKKKKDTAPKEEEKLEEKPAEEPQAQTDPEPLPMEQHDELDNENLPDPSTVTADIEQDEEVFPPATEQTKEVIITKSDPGTPRESDEFKGSMSSLLSDEWQPRRSERIFINSSVTTSSSSSPLSPTGKGSEFSYTKKPKRMSITKGKPGRSGSLGEEDLEESDVIPLKAKAKPKKKKGPGKGKKRSSSTAADFDEYEPSKVSRRARSKSRQTIGFDDADEEEEADELQEEEEPHEEAETDVEINVTDKMEASEEQAEEVPAPPDVSAESGSDFKPETEVDVEQMETEKIESKEVADVEMKEDEEADEKNVIEEKKDVEASEKSEEKESEEEPAKEEENEEKEEAVVERPASPVDVRFTFLIDELVEGVKLLLPVDSVFYPGRINTFNEPDLFGVILDGERGRRPHWKSTEQLLNEAVKDVQPPSDKFLSIGTRVCAHWSPQYRCFYPGTVTEAPPDEKEVDGKIWIEFDDGDSGFFQLNEIKRIHPDFPVEDVESTPSLPEKRPRSSSLGAGSQSTTQMDSSSRLRLKAEENFSSGNESSGEVQAKRRRLRGKRKSKDDSWLPSKHLANSTKDSVLSKGDSFRSRTKEVQKSDSETTRVKDKSSSDSQESKVTDAPKQKANRMRGKTETKVENKETPPRTAENTKQDLATVASAELKESEKEIHSSDSSIKTESYENNSKQSSEKTRAALDNTTESSDQGDDSEATSDVETSKHDKGTRAGSKSSSRTSEKDLRRRSLNLSLSSSFRSSRVEGESPTRDVMSTSQDEDSESYSDTFDESPLVENKSFQPRLGRRRRSELDRLQVDMKCSGPLWQWSGRSFQNKRKGKGKKSFYKAIVRGDETICVGDCAVFTSNPTKNLNLPYVGRIESMWEGCVGNMVVRVKWFYHPEETKPGRKPSDGKQSLYRSTHVDENDVQTISHKCEVLTPEEFKKRSQSLDTPSAKNRVFCCIGSYDPNNETLSTEL